MPDVSCLVVVGVGLIGGSIGKAALERKVAAEVIGVGRNMDTLRKAKAVGAASKVTTDFERACGVADLIVVCTPVDTVAKYVRAAAKACKSATLITDAGSTKEKITDDVPEKLPNGTRFVGSHPLAGSEKTGATHARADLFAGRVTVITPTESTASEDVVRLSSFWNALGAKVHVMSPAEHDRAVAATSHAPHLIAAALAAATESAYLPLTAGGWLDTTRIAAMDPAIWLPIFASNRGNVLKSLDRFEKTLAALRKAMDRSDARALTKILNEAKQNRDSVSPTES